MQATIAGTAASGVLVSALRIFTKAVYPQDASGLQKSANLYFVVSIVILFIRMVFYNFTYKLPILKYYNELKINAVSKEDDNGPLTRFFGGQLCRIPWEESSGIYGFGIMLFYVVTLAIFPGYITENVHSQLLKDWYPVLLITSFKVFDKMHDRLLWLLVLKIFGLVMEDL